MGKKSPPPKAPDLTPVTNAQLQIAKDSNELAREYLGMSREQFAWMQENAKEELALAREQATKLMEYQDKVFASDQEAKDFARQVGQTQIDAMKQQMGYAAADRKRWEETFLPMQDRYIAEANAYDTPERREAEASRAGVDIQRQAEAARANADQRLRSMGLDPSQMRSATLLDTQNTALAAQQAAAMNNARQNVEDRGRAMRADALNVGSGLPAQALAGYAGATNSGQGALQAGQAGQNAQLGAISGGAGLAGTALGFRSNALNNVAQLTGSPMQWAQMGGGMMGQAMSGYGNAANTMSQGFNNQMASWKAGQEQSQQSFNNVMSVAGLAAGMMMAEGGEVRRPRRYAEGGAIAREKFPLASAALDMGNEASHAIAMRAPSMALPSKPNGPSLRSRFANGMDMAMSVDPGNVWAEQEYVPTPMVQYAAEGGSMRARGALPVRQSRDMIPAYLAEGEFVVPADVVRAVGLEKLDKMVAKYHRENA